MDDEGQNLGPPVAWHIRSIPEQVRQHFVDLAHDERCTVAELFTRMATSTAGATVVDVSAAEVLQLVQSLEALARASSVPIPDRTARSCYALIGQMVRGARRQPRAQPRQPALPGAALGGILPLSDSPS